MAQFEQRISEIGAAIADLVAAVKQADQEVGQLDQKFDQLIRNANTITQLAESVEQLDAALSRIGDGSGLVALQTRLQAVAKEIRELDGTKITRVTDMLQKQSALVNSLAESQMKITEASRQSQESFARTKSELSELVTTLATADVKLGEFSKKLLGDLELSTTNAQELVSIIRAIGETSQKLNPEAWASTAQGFQKLANAINKIELHKLEALQSISTSGAPITVNIGKHPAHIW
jgi:chromosome segregation ATPase